MITVIHPGAATLVVDLGVKRRAHQGVSRGGAADPLAHRLANRAVGNPDDARALEMTLMGPTLRFDVDARIAVVGAPYAMSGVHEIAAGRTIKFGSCLHGLRATIAVAGGITSAFGATLTFGAATPRLAAHGLVEHRDVEDRQVEDRQVDYPQYRLSDAPIRVTDAPQRSWFDDAFFEREWNVTSDSNRRGIRLSGEALSVPARDMITEGVTAGAIQVPPSGQPVILFVDQQTTGGYPKIAHVITADLHRLAQLRPGSRVRFTRISFDDARQVKLPWT